MVDVIARGPDDGDEPIAQPPVSHKALLAIITAIVGDRDPRARQHPPGVGEIEPAVLERPLTLGRVEADLHGLDLRP